MVSQLNVHQYFSIHIKVIGHFKNSGVATTLKYPKKIKDIIYNNKDV